MSDKAANCGCSSGKKCQCTDCKCKKCPGETCPNQFSLTEYNHHLLIGGAFAALLIGFVAYKKMQ